jgi:hypothetical protein
MIFPLDLGEPPSAIFPRNHTAYNESRNLHTLSFYNHYCYLFRIPICIHIGVDHDPIESSHINTS